MNRIFLLVSLILLCLGCGRPELSLKERTVVEGRGTVAFVYMNEDVEDGAKFGNVRLYCGGVWVENNKILTAGHCVKALYLRQLEEKKHLGRMGMSQEDKDADDAKEAIMKIFGIEPEVDEADLVGMVVHYSVENEVVDVGMEPSGWHMGKVKAYNEKHDLALVEAVNNELPTRMVVKLAVKNPIVGERVYGVGHKGGLFYSYSEGIVSAFREGDNSGGPFIQVQMPVYSGDSGSGVFNDHGELIGIVDLMSSARDTGFIVSLNELKVFLEESKEEKVLIKRKHEVKIEITPSKTSAVKTWGN